MRKEVLCGNCNWQGSARMLRPVRRGADIIELCPQCEGEELFDALPRRPACTDVEAA
jgi:uncharacterized protein (DUF983 family)